jgi:hypothetical protein
MTIVRLPYALLLFLAIVTMAQGAEPGVFLGKPDCRIASVMPAPTGAVSWSGDCKDGYANGKGVLEWDAAGEGKRRLEAALVRGEVSGEGKLTYRDGSYTGTFRRGMPHGTGFFKYADGNMYEGGVDNGQSEGRGLQIALDGSTFEGEWHADKLHGRGKAVFTLGGSYEGEWRNGKMHGQGKIVYSGGRSHVGEFVDGRAVGTVPVSEGEPGNFGLKANQPLTGSNLLYNRVLSHTPLDASWEALTPAQKARLRSLYPALDERDEPPYPLKGTRAFLKGVADLYQLFTDYRGNALVYVTVDADGVPTAVSTYGVTHREFGRNLSMLAMLQRFKPALCAGKPCTMIFPLSFSFDRE